MCYIVIMMMNKETKKTFNELLAEAKADREKMTIVGYDLKGNAIYGHEGENLLTSKKIRKS